MNRIFNSTTLTAALALCAFAATAGEVKAPRNNLAGEASAYLRQHADDPIDWYPWSDEAFAKARAQKKPIFVSVGYFSCHWCHVMERESFENPRIAKFVNDNFIAIKVDRERRPSVDDSARRSRG